MIATFVSMTFEEAKKLKCMDCEYHVYKGDEEQYCRIARWREFSLNSRQRKPGFCPILKRAKMQRDEGKTIMEG